MNTQQSKDIIVCPIHGNKEYKVEPSHFCENKINEGCNCICTCPTPSPAEGWKERFDKLIDLSNFDAPLSDRDYKKCIDFISSIEHQSYQKGREEVAKDISNIIIIPINPSNDDQRDWYRGLGKEEEARNIREKFENYIKSKGISLSDSSESTK